METRLFKAALLLASLSGCSVDVTSTSAIAYFAEASSSAMAPMCHAKPDKNGRVQSILEAGATYTLNWERGLICVRGLDGSLTKVFRYELASVAGYRWVDRTRFGLFEAPRLERRGPDGSWIKIAD